MIPSDITTISICGAGTMGSGIAQLFAQSGFQVTLFDVDKKVLEKAAQNIHKQFSLLLEKGKVSEDFTGNIRYTSLPGDCRTDLVIEAIVENTEAKSSLFRQLSEVNEGFPCIFVSNTSSILLTTLSHSVKNKSAFAGMHFFNPATRMKLVEIVRTPETDEAAVNLLMRLCTRIDKTAVLCNDVPGFIVNRVARPYYLESLHLAGRYQLPFEIIDNIMEATGFRMGPFRLMDFIGNDINFTVSVSLYEALGRPPRLKPSPIQEEKVQRGALGIKSGSGYYEYPRDSNR